MEKGFKKIAASENGTIIMMPILLRRDIPEAVPMEHNVDDQVMTQEIGQFSSQGINRILRHQEPRIKLPVTCRYALISAMESLRSGNAFPAASNSITNGGGGAFGEGKLARDSPSSHNKHRLLQSSQEPYPSIIRDRIRPRQR
jgi:hypothetical protein